MSVFLKTSMLDWPPYVKVKFFNFVIYLLDFKAQMPQNKPSTKPKDEMQRGPRKRTKIFCAKYVK